MNIKRNIERKNILREEREREKIIIYPKEKSNITFKMPRNDWRIGSCEPHANYMKHEYYRNQITYVTRSRKSAIFISLCLIISRPITTVRFRRANN